MNKPEFIILHHSGGTNANPLADTSHHTLETIKAGHIARGFTDVGYHFVIEKDGKLRKGRAENRAGAHALGYNQKSIGICMAGNFDATFPTKEQENTLLGLLKELMAKYKIPVEKCIYHRDVAQKTCPGKNIPKDYMQKLLSKVVEKELRDDDAFVKDYLAKQKGDTLWAWVTYIISLLRK